jgi:hypothetical protein
VASGVPEVGKRGLSLRASNFQKKKKKKKKIAEKVTSVFSQAAVPRAWLSTAELGRTLCDNYGDFSYQVRIQTSKKERSARQPTG